MKKMRQLAVCVLMLCLLMTGMASMRAQATEAGEGIEGVIGESCSMEDSFVEGEDSIVSASTGANISGITFTYADVRTPSNTRTFNGGDGKYHILVYGGVGSCGNTNSAVTSLSKLTAYMDLNQVEINVFDIQNNGNDTITSLLVGNTISADIKVCRGRGDMNLWTSCYQAAGGGSYTMPIIAYVNTWGDIVKATTGYTTTTSIQNNIEAMGLKVDMEASYQVLNVTGTVDYAAAYQVLNLMNKDRQSAGLSALTMDPGLLEAAMQRAAEISMYFDHERPNGENCYSLESKMYAENIALGYKSAAEAEKGWMNSSGHKSNILSSSAGSVGIGVFYIDGTYFWVQCFGRAGLVNAVQPANATRTYSIQTLQTLVDPYLRQITLAFNKKNDKAAFEVLVTNKKYGYVTVHVDASSYNWSCDNGNFTVDANGVMTAQRWGHTNVSIVNKNNTNYNLAGEATLYTNATVSNPGIFLAEVSKNQIVAGMTHKLTEPTDMEYTWYLSTDDKNWSCLQDWKENDEWLRWTPDTFGDYYLRCMARVQGNQSSVVDCSIPISFHPHIKGKCQMPYTGPGVDT